MPTIFDLDTPTLLVDLDVLEANISEMAGIAARHGKALRPHTKTHKTPEIARMQMEAGAVGLTVAKLSEAEALVNAGLVDIFIANEIVGAAKVMRLLDLMGRARICVGVDSVEVAAPIAHEASRCSMTVPVRIEIDTGLGRAGTRSVDEALRLAARIADLPGLELEGVFTHEGHLYKLADGAARHETAKAVVGQLMSLAGALAAQGTPARVISVGSTPGAGLMAPLDGPTELRPGVYVFNDRIQQGLGRDSSQCALTVLTTVISVRPDGKVITDAGSKSFSGDRLATDSFCGEVFSHPELQFVGMSEEHGHLQICGASAIHVGDKLRVVPNHACTCVNQHDTLTAFRGEKVEATWTITGRGRLC